MRVFGEGHARDHREVHQALRRPDRSALNEPVTITKNGRDRLVLLSVDGYARLKRRDCRALAAEELSEAELALIAAAEVPAERADLDAELADGTP